MAWAVSLIDKQLFPVALVVSYWITNIAGLIMLHKGVSPEAKGCRKKNMTDLIIAVIYTGVIILLLHFGLLKLPQECFIHKSQ